MMAAQAALVADLTGMTGTHRRPIAANHHQLAED